MFACLKGGEAFIKSCQIGLRVLIPIVILGKNTRADQTVLMDILNCILTSVFIPSHLQDHTTSIRYYSGGSNTKNIRYWDGKGGSVLFFEQF